MPTSAITALATITLGSAQATVTFSSISAGFRDLRLVSSVPSLSGAPTVSSAFLRLNGDSGANYSIVYAYGDGASAGSTTGSLMQYALGANASGFIDTTDILDYSATDKHKTVLARTSNTNGAWMSASRWASTAAITTILITAPDSGARTFGIGSTFTLYGVSA